MSYITSCRLEETRYRGRERGCGKTLTISGEVHHPVNQYYSDVTLCHLLSYSESYLRGREFRVEVGNIRETKPLLSEVKKFGTKEFNIQSVFYYVEHLSNISNLFLVPLCHGL